MTDNVVNADNTVIESLHKQLADLQAASADKDAKIESLETSLSESQKAYDSAVIANADLLHEVESAHLVNVELSKEIENLSAKADKQPAESCFEYEGILYGFHYHKTVLNGDLVTSKDVAQSEALQAELVSIGSGMIYPKH